MLSLGLMTDMVLNDIVSNANNVHGAAVAMYIQQHYLTLCMERKVGALRKEAEITPDSNGLCILPSDLQGEQAIESVVDSSGNSYMKSEDAERLRTFKYNYNWFFDNNPEPIFACTTGSVTANSANASIALDSSASSVAAGDFVKIGDGYYPYRIEAVADTATTKTITLYDEFRGANASTQRMEFRPAGTKAISMCDSNSQPVLPSKMYLTYYSLPLPLYNRYDPILLPGSCEDLRLMVIQSMLRRFGKPREARQLSDDIRMEKALTKNDAPRSREQFRPTKMFARRRVEVTNFGSNNVWRD